MSSSQTTHVVFVDGDRFQTVRRAAREVVVGDTIISGSAVTPLPLTIERIEETEDGWIIFNRMVHYRTDVDVHVVVNHE